VRRAAANGAVPQIERTVALLVRYTFTGHHDRVRGAIVPQPPGTAAN
jgi:hypothetical protein